MLNLLLSSWDNTHDFVFDLHKDLIEFIDDDLEVLNDELFHLLNDH